jgi:hypothetical protein
MDTGSTSTYQKARQINLDSAIHGTFAEIGAGQEVARWFFHVGGAASTVAKTMSAYDMAVSDAIYGPCERYVSRERLRAMLDHEYDLLLERLGQARGATTRFFVFAETVAARSYARREDGHGWMGVRFQHQPQAEPCEIILHLRMLDTENVREQEALGILGVNLIYGAFYLQREPVLLIRSLMDDLAPGRVEIDMIRFSGPIFVGTDNRLMSLQLVEQRFTDAAMFTSDGEVVQPAERDPLSAVHSGPEPVVTDPLLEVLEEVVVGVGPGKERAQRRDVPVGVDSVELHGAGARRLPGTRGGFGHLSDERLEPCPDGRILRFPAESLDLGRGARPTRVKVMRHVWPVLADRVV